jgi:hypothetical protein
MRTSESDSNGQRAADRLDALLRMAIGTAPKSLLDVLPARPKASWIGATRTPSSASPLAAR